MTFLALIIAGFSEVAGVYFIAREILNLKSLLLAVWSLLLAFLCGFCVLV